MKKKVVAQLLPSLISGGIERGVTEINSYLTKNGFESIVISSGGRLTKNIENAGGKNIILDVATKNPFKIYGNIKKIRKIIIDNDIEVLHVRSRAPAWSAYYACKGTSCRLVSTIHGNYSISSIPIISQLKRWYNSSMVKADFVICVSNFIKEYAYKNYKLFREKVEKCETKVIYRGADIELFNPDKVSQERIIAIKEKMHLPDDKNIILLPGRFTEWKGQLYFLDVLAKVKCKNFICIMIGDTKGHEKYKSKVENKVRKLRLDGLVKIEPNSPDLAAVYMLSDIVVSSSIRGEAFGRIPPEAQAMKRLVVATSIGGALETIVDKKTGWLIDVGDIDGFAKIIDELINMPCDERMKIGEQARQHIVENYTIEKMCKETVDVYNDMINS